MNATKAQLKKWIHPATGAVRVYVNSDRLQYGQKMWFEQCGPSDCQYTSKLRAYSEHRDSCFGMIQDSICDDLKEQGFNIDNWDKLMEQVA